MSFVHNLNQLVPHLDHDPPLSRPGCWAYPDAVQTGNFRTFEESRANFGAWVISSSPLILGMKLTDTKRLSSVWPIITNQEAIKVNHQFAGHPGKLVRRWVENTTVHLVRAVPCEQWRAAQEDWELKPAEARNASFIVSKSTGLCADASESGGQGSSGVQLQPCVERGPLSACQQFKIDSDNGVIHAPNCLSNGGLFNGCFDIAGKIGPTVQLTKCYNAPNDMFTWTKSGIWSTRYDKPPLYPRRCIEAMPSVTNATIEAHLWAKPQPGGAMAVFLLNSLPHEVEFTIHLQNDLKLPSMFEYTVRDVWEHADLAAIPPGGQLTSDSVPSHDSRLYVLTPVQASPSFI